MKLINYYKKFMKNRYGVDELNKFLLKIYLIILFINIFLNFYIFNYLKLFIFIVFIFRSLSKNKFDRSKENRIFLDIKNKKYIYKKCRKCKKKLRLPLPKKIGIKKVVCPSCKNKIKVIVLRKRKD